MTRSSGATSFADAPGSGCPLLRDPTTKLPFRASNLRHNHVLYVQPIFEAGETIAHDGGHI